MKSFGKVCRTLLMVSGCAAALAGAAGAHVQSPSSSGEVAMLDEPVFRIPKTSTPPTIDGVMEEGEWEDASALSGFWYDTMNSHHFFLAPFETQLQLYAMYDDDYLYFAYVSPTHPEGSWLRTRGRIPNLLNHPRYGVLRDDHIELELRPYHDYARGFQLGLLKWSINPIDNVVDHYWSPHQATQWGWDSGARVQSVVTDTHWTIEIAIPHEAFVHGLYDGVDADGNEIVTLPPPDGTVYRCWFLRGIGGTGPFSNIFDKHVWNTTKTRLIFDSNAVAFQINELGPIKEDIIDVFLTVKNHSNRSESVRLGFFVENVYGLIYSSYEDSEITDGILELIPGEVRRLRLRRPFPGITERGNVLWFDVRTAGVPARPIYMTRLADFHVHDLPHERYEATLATRICRIADLRPPRLDFDLTHNYSPHNGRISVIVDRGIHGASEAAHTAVEARFGVADIDSGEEIASHMATFKDNFAIGIFDLPELEGRDYELTALLFDRDRRIVGDMTNVFNRWGIPSRLVDPHPSRPRGPIDQHTHPDEYMDTELGLGDTVWEPYTPLEVTEDGFRTLKHEFTLAESGLPAQIFIKPTHRTLPLELRGRDAGEIGEEQLVEAGRGPMLRAPVRLEAVVDGRRHQAEVIEPASPVRQWDSELVYRSKLRVGPADVTLEVQYDCDGSWHVRLGYGSEDSEVIESLEMITDVRGPVDMATSGLCAGHMAGSPIWECALPDYEGIVWDITTQERDRLQPDYFVPWFHFGSSDRGFSWMNETNRGWGLDRNGSCMRLERNAAGEVSWIVQFVNHPFDIEGERSIAFSIIVHPAKPKPDGYRTMAWHYHNVTSAGFVSEPIDLSEEYLRGLWRQASCAPDHIPYEQAHTWRKQRPDWFYGYGMWVQKPIPSMHIERTFEQRAVYMVERQIRVGRRHGYWWDELWPTFGGTSENLASGYSTYLRDPDDICEDMPVPWRGGHINLKKRNMQKRLARIFAENNVPYYAQIHWANASARAYDGLGHDAHLVEGAGNNHRGFDLDMRTIYPMSLYRSLTNPFTGLVARHLGGETPGKPGDDRRLCRQWTGPQLLHDIGTEPESACGTVQHLDEFLRTIDILDEFGYFDEAGTEFFPYWRNADALRWGSGRQRYAPRPELNIHEPDEELYVSVYRRAIEDEDGRSGYKAIFVVYNDFREEVTADLTILDPERIFGGPNTLMRSDVLGDRHEEFGELGGLLDEWTSHNGRNVPVLLDLETGAMVELNSTEGGKTYGSVYVPRHNFRLLYGHFME